MPPLVVEKVDSIDDFNKVVAHSASILSGLKPVEADYDKIYDELRNLNVAISPNPTLQQISIEIQKVQSAKDRVAEILVDVNRNYLARKRVSELLRDGWAPFSQQNSAEKRKGEAFIKMHEFIESATEAESLYKATAHIMKNLDSKHESLSRQVTVSSLMLKLNDFSHTSDDRSQQKASAMISASASLKADLRPEKDEADNEDLYDWEK
jgi:hypothetical protein